MIVLAFGITKIGIKTELGSSPHRFKELMLHIDLTPKPIQSCIIRIFLLSLEFFKIDFVTRNLINNSKYEIQRKISNFGITQCKYYYYDFFVGTTTEN